MGIFIEYAESKKLRELAKLSADHGIDLKPLVELSEWFLDSDYAPEEIYSEFLQQSANMVGNLVGRTVRGVGNTWNSFKQGYQQGRGYPQGNPSGQTQGNPSTPYWNPNWGQQEQNPYNKADANELPLNLALRDLNMLKQNIQRLAARGTDPTPDFVIQYLDQISQKIFQVLNSRYGGARVQFKTISIK